MLQPENCGHPFLSHVCSWKNDTHFLCKSDACVVPFFMRTGVSCVNFVFLGVSPRVDRSVHTRNPPRRRQVGSYWWFQVLFGMGTLLKCYYSAFYFSYAIGRATE